MTTSRSPSAVHGPYRRSLLALYLGSSLLALAVATLAATDDSEASGAQWWLPASLFTVVIVRILLRWRTLGATVTDGKVLHLRTIWQDRSVRLDDLDSVAVIPSRYYADQLKEQQRASQSYGIRLVDRAGDALTLPAQRSRAIDFYANGADIAAAVADALADGAARCDPSAWETVHHEAHRDVPPFPRRLTEPPEGSWGTPLIIPRRQRVAWLFVVFVLTAPPLGIGTVAALALGSSSPLQAITAIGGGMMATALFWTPLWWMLRQGDRDQVVMTQSGRLTSVARNAGFLTLGFGLCHGEVDMSRLRHIQAVPGAATKPDFQDSPQWWKLELEDEDGGAAHIHLMQSRAPRATLLPQLAHFVERSAIQLDRTTTRVIELRLGRALQSRRSGADSQPASGEDQ